MTGWLIALSLAPAIALAQSQIGAPAKPKFEVASIRPCKNGDEATGSGESKGGRGGGILVSPGSLYLACRTVETLIQYAYLGYPDGKPWNRRDAAGFAAPPISMRLLLQPIKGAPTWVSSRKYTVQAKAGSPQSAEMMRGPMMQALLEDRFKLKLHHETKETPVYVLTVVKGGPKLQRAKEGSCLPRKPEDAPYVPGQPPWCGWFRVSPSHDAEDTYGQTMAGLCTQFSAELDRDVIDKTGIAGEFDIHLDLPEDLSTPAMQVNRFDPISAAVRKLGLRLEPAKGIGEFLVIDHIENPSQN